MRNKLLTMAVLLGCMAAQAQTRQEILLQDDWQFSREKQAWTTVSVPHDWAISGPFDKKWDLQTVAIVQNGETQATAKSGRYHGLARAFINVSSLFHRVLRGMLSWCSMVP